MDRTLRCEHLARLSDSELAHLTDRIPTDQRVVISEPTVGMIMTRAIEGARGETFNLGEVLVTECQVRIDEREGWGMVLGSRKQAALAMATIDAACAADTADTREIDDLIVRLIAVHDAELQAKEAQLAATRVQFEVQ